MRHVPDIERRSRLVRRHALGPHHRLTDPVAAAESVVCLHAEAEADRLSTWLDGVSVGTIYHSPAMKTARGR